MTGLLLAAPSSGAGKTTLTLGILRALRQDGIAVRSAKSGPDYIDPQFHHAASGRPCLNLDAWAMTPERLLALATGPGQLIVEGAMGLFDGAADGRGSSADLAAMLGLPVVLIVDCARQAQSVAALVHGFASYRPDMAIEGVILNNTGSPRHGDMLRDALAPLGMPILGTVPRAPALARPSRHLGLVQAREAPDLEAFLNAAADHMRAHVDLDALLALAQPLRAGSAAAPLRPPAQRIAVAQDDAFAFSYPHMLAGWRDAGAQITLFSPLADAPVPSADFVFLPGGYPELHAGLLSGNQTFLNSLRNAAQNSDIYGECGGYMMLGETLTDADGHAHQMAGLLPLHTSFATRKRHLGYRKLTGLAGPFAGPHRGHEFHYATTGSARGAPLFTAQDATGNALPDMGLRAGRVCGSFAHVIDAAPDA